MQSLQRIVRPGGVLYLSWRVTAGANGGRFTAAFRIGKNAQFVARWAGDSGRQGAGSSVLTVTRKRRRTDTTTVISSSTRIDQ